VRGGVASGSGLMMLLDPDMPAGLLDEAAAALLDPEQVPGDQRMYNGPSPVKDPVNKYNIRCVHGATPVSGLRRTVLVAALHRSYCGKRCCGRTIAMRNTALCCCSREHRARSCCCCSGPPAAAGSSRSRQHREPLVRRPDPEEVAAQQRAERLQQQLEVRCYSVWDSPSYFFLWSHVVPISTYALHLGPKLCVTIAVH